MSGKSPKMTEEREAALHELEGKLGYTFSDLHLLDTALTHSSYANEQGPGHKYNERLEFLGDSVLGFITADKFFHAFRDIPEGRLTKLRASTSCPTPSKRSSPPSTSTGPSTRPESSSSGSS